MKRKRALLIINPNAGKKRVRQHMFVILDELAQAGYSATVEFTQRHGHGIELAHTAQRDNFDLVVCSGGDGTLNEVISGLLDSGSNIPLAYIPAGSTNDFAATLGFSREIPIAAKDAVTGNAAYIDIGHFNHKYFSYVASFGIFTKASYTTDQNAKNLLGSAAYILEGIKDIASVHEHSMRIEVNGETISDTFIFGAVANTTSLGGVISIDPADVSLDDGRFEYLFVKKPNNISDVVKAMNAISSYNYKSDTLYFGSSDNIDIYTQSGMDWSLDGEYSFSGTHTKISVINKGIQMVIPHRGRISEVLTCSEENLQLD